MKEIRKKTWPKQFKKVLSGEKIHEFRLADFDLEAGDVLVLEEWDPETEAYTGRSIRKQVGYISYFDVDDTFWSRAEIEQHGVYIMSLTNESEDMQ